MVSYLYKESDLPQAIIGYEYKNGASPTNIGENSKIRTGTIIYADVRCGNFFQTGHHVLIREKTIIGDHVVIGTNSIIDGNVTIGSFVKIESNCYIPTHTSIGSRVFIGPGVTMTNDKYPLKMRDSYVPVGPTIEDGVTIGGGVTILPGITIGKGSFIAAGSLVTKDIPPMSLVIGSPCQIKELPDNLAEENIALSWMPYMQQLSRGN